MKSIKFARKKALLITSDNTKNIILKKIENLLGVSQDIGCYKLLNTSNLKNIVNKKTKFSLVTCGQRFYLYLTTLNEKKYCFFISTQTNDIVSIRLRFEEHLFENTLITGELFKNNYNTWFYFMNDICTYKNKNKTLLSLSSRQKILRYLLKNEYERDSNLDPCVFQIKPYFNLCYLSDFVSKIKGEDITYKISGLIFRDVYKMSNDYIYVYPDSRVGNKTIDDKPMIFKVKDTSLPDVYELFCRENNDLVKYGIASVPNLKTSKMLNSVYKSIDNDTDVLFICEYNKVFDKFIPIKQSTQNYISTIEEIKKYISINK